MADVRRMDDPWRTIRDLKRELADLKATVLSRLGTHTHPDLGGGGGVTDHGALTGLGDDDHPQYLTQARGDARYYTETEIDGFFAGLADVATSGAYADLTGTPTIPDSPDDIGAQPLDSDLTTIAGLTPTNGQLLRRVSGAWAAYTMSASDITTGTLPFAQLPTGTGASQVAVGNHNHDGRYYTETETDSLLSAKADSADLAAVATSGDYDDLINAPAAYTDEQVRDVMGTTLVAGSNVTITPDDAGDTITISATPGGGGVTDHGALTGLGDDDHTQYLNNTRGDARYYTKTQSDAAYQPLDSDLTAIGGLVPTNNDIIQRKSGAWTNRTPAQLKTDLALAKGDVGLGNVTNDAQIPKSLVDAKGDLLVGTANDTPARVAVGTNGQVLTADSSQASGVKWADLPGGSTYKYKNSLQYDDSGFVVTDNDLQFNVVANSVYIIEGFLSLYGVGNMIFFVNCPSGASISWSVRALDLTNGTFGDVTGPIDTVVQSVSGTVTVKVLSLGPTYGSGTFNGLLRTAGTAGTFSIAYSRSSGSTIAGLSYDSWMKLTKVA
ncbi:hypothetical protein ACFQH9_02175 [Pseudonocardia lutea]|uniref:Tail fiber-like repeat protein n=1 Tax=Pseudonocardia lutea TaxID=2172015 RepID=A0ABW1I3U3_9PSEU